MHSDWIAIRDTAGFDSNNAIGRTVRERWCEIAPNEDLPTARSIGTKFGKLVSGDATWWRARPSAQQALADVVKEDIEDLFPPVRGQDSDSFARLPAMQPFSRTRDKPAAMGLCYLAGHRPSLSYGRTQVTMSWFEVDWQSPTWTMAPAGSGKTFAVRWHMQTPDVHSATVATLDDALGLVGRARRLFIELEQPGPDDLQALSALTRMADVFIVAPFARPLPAPPAVDSGGDFGRNGEGEGTTEEPDPETRKNIETVPGNAGADRSQSAETGPVVPWLDLEWHASAAGRRRYVEWVAQRLPTGTLLSAAAVQAWLDAQDPGLRLFGTPGDVLDVCAVAHRQGEWALKKEGLTALSQAWLSQPLTGRDGVGDSERAWLIEHLEGLLTALVGARFDDLRFKAEGGLKMRQWRELIPAEFVQVPWDQSALDRELDEVVMPGRQADRRQIAALLAERMSAPRPERAADLLRLMGVLRPTADGHWDLGPKWLRTHITLLHAARLLAAQATARWGAYAVDPARCKWLDIALDECTDPVLERVVDDLISNPDKYDIGHAGAVDATFAAVARRWARSRPVQLSQGRLGALASAQRAVCRIGFMGVFVMEQPVARALHGGLHLDHNVEWVANCWQWSSSADRPAGSWSDWLFPGWADDLRLSNAFVLKNLRGSARSYREELPATLGVAADSSRDPHFGRMLEMAGTWLDRCVIDGDADETPPVFAAERVVRCAIAGETVPGKLLASLEGDPWQMALIERRLDALDASDADRLAAALFASVAGHRDIYAAIRPWREAKSLHGKVMKRLKPEHINAALPEEALRHVNDIMRDIQPRFQAAVVRRLIKREGGLQFRQLRDVALSPEAAAILASDGPDDWWVAQMVWASQPAVALEVMGRLSPEDTAWKRWLGQAPDSQLVSLLPLAERLPKEHHRDWLTRWALRRLGSFPHLAQRLWQLSLGEVSGVVDE